MVRKLAAGAVMVAALVFGARAEAGVYADDLSKCLVKSASAEDHLTLVRWMFGAMSQHPALQSMTNLTQAQRDDFNRAVTALFERLTYVDCRPEAISGLKYEGGPAMVAAFNLLGQVAARDIFTDPHVGQALTAIAKYSDKAKRSALYKDAGVPEPADPAAK